MDILFRLRPLKDVTVTAYYAGKDLRGAAKYRAEVKVNGQVLFPADGNGAVLYGSFAPSYASDGDDARRQVLEHVGVRPGDTDDDFFEKYTPEQLAFVKANGEEISFIATSRYGEE